MPGPGQPTSLLPCLCREQEYAAEFDAVALANAGRPVTFTGGGWARLWSSRASAQGLVHTLCVHSRGQPMAWSAQGRLH